MWYHIFFFSFFLQNYIHIKKTKNVKVVLPPKKTITQKKEVENDVI